MNTDEINEAFEKLVAERGTLEKLGVSSGDVRSMRYSLNHAIVISIDKKLEWLQKAGLLEKEKTYTRADLICLLDFYLHTSQEARDEGPASVIEKWEESRNENI